MSVSKKEWQRLQKNSEERRKHMNSTPCNRAEYMMFTLFWSQEIDTDNLYQIERAEKIKKSKIDRDGSDPIIATELTDSQFKRYIKETLKDHERTFEWPGLDDRQKQDLEDYCMCVRELYVYQGDVR